MPLPLRFLLAVFLILIAAGSLVLIKNAIENDGDVTEIAGLAPEGSTETVPAEAKDTPQAGAGDPVVPVDSDSPDSSTSEPAMAEPDASAPASSEADTSVAQTTGQAPTKSEPAMADQDSADSAATDGSEMAEKSPAEDGTAGQDMDAQPDATAQTEASDPAVTESAETESASQPAASDTAMATGEMAEATEASGDDQMAAASGDGAAENPPAETEMVETGIAAVEPAPEPAPTPEPAPEPSTDSANENAAASTETARSSGESEPPSQASPLVKSQDQLPSDSETEIAMAPKMDSEAPDTTDKNITEVAKNAPQATELGALDTTPKTPESTISVTDPVAPATGDEAGSGMSDTPAPVADAPKFDVVRVEPTGEAVLAGRGSPGATVEILANGEVIAEAVAGPTGEWVVVPDRPLPPGANDISARARLADGPVIASQERVAIAVPEQPDGGMLIIRNRPNAPSEVLVDTTKPPKTEAAAAAGTSGDTGQAGSEMAAAPPQMPVTPFTIEAVEAEDQAVFMAGAGTMGAKVRVYANNEFIGETMVGEGDRWLLQEPRALPFGELTIRADMTGAGGDVVSRAEVPFSRPRQMAAAPASETAGQKMAAAPATDDPAAAKSDVHKPASVIIRRGDNLWTIARRTYGRGIRYTTIFEANTDQIRNPHLIFPGQVFMLPENAGEEGSSAN